MAKWVLAWLAFNAIVKRLKKGPEMLSRQGSWEGDPKHFSQETRLKI